VYRRHLLRLPRNFDAMEMCIHEHPDSRHTAEEERMIFGRTGLVIGHYLSCSYKA
jgi:hypothetical protein